MKPAQAAEQIAAACQDAIVEAQGRRWKAAEGLLRDATHLAARMTSARAEIVAVKPLADTEARYSQSLQRGLSILALFTEKRPVWGIADIGGALGYPRGTAHRYATTLVALGQLEQAAGRKYKRVA